MLPRPVRAVVFDMDGLLCDTEALYRDAMIAAAADLGHEMSLPMFLSLVGVPAGESNGLLQTALGADFPIERFRKGVGARVNHGCEAGVALKAGVIELLDALDARSLPRAIATSSSPRAVQRHLGPSGILPRFHAVIAEGDYPRGKPAPDPYLVAAQRLGVDPALCLALEDSHNGVRSAAAAGMMTVMVPDLLAATDEMRGLCARIARDLHEVREMLG